MLQQFVFANEHMAAGCALTWPTRYAICDLISDADYAAT